MMIDGVEAYRRYLASLYRQKLGYELVDRAQIARPRRRRSGGSCQNV